MTRISTKVSAMIAVVVSLCFNGNIWAIGFELFQCPKAESVKIAPAAKNKVDCGLYLSDTLSHLHYDFLLEEMKKLVAVLESRGLVNGVDYFFSGAYLFYLPKDGKSTDPDIADAIGDMKEALSTYHIKPSLRGNGKWKSYVRSFPASFSNEDSLDAIIRPVSFSFDSGRMNHLSEFADMNQRLLEHRSAKKEVESQLKLVLANSKKIGELLKQYKDFDQLYAEMQQIKPAISTIMANPSGKCEFKRITKYLVTGSWDYDFFSNVGKSGEKTFVDRKISFSQLNDLVSKTSNQNDKSILMIRKYLQLLNVIFLNKNSIPELIALTSNPYGDIPVLTLSEHKFSVDSSNPNPLYKSGSFSGTYAFVNMEHMLNSYIVKFSNNDNNTALVVFDSDSPVANLSSLRKIEPLLKNALADEVATISGISQALKTNDGYQDFAKGTAEDYLQHYYFVSSLNQIARASAGAVNSTESDTSGDRAVPALESGADTTTNQANNEATASSVLKSNIEDRPFIASLLFNYRQDISEFLAPDADVLALDNSLKELNGKLKAGKHRYDIYPQTNKWIVIGKS